MTQRQRAEAVVLQAARRFARLKAFGFAVDDHGSLIKDNHTSRDAQVNQAKVKLADAADYLVAVMATDETEGRFTE